MRRLHAAFFAGMALAFAPAIAGTAHLDKGLCQVAPPRLSRRLRVNFGLGQAPGRIASRRGPGWTHAVVRRMARKRRQVLRNRMMQRRAR